MYEIMIFPPTKGVDALEEWLNEGARRGFRLVACNGDWYIFERRTTKRALDWLTGVAQKFGLAQNANQ